MKRRIANEVLLGEVCKSLIDGKKVRLRAKGHSMHPFILGERDTLVIKPVTILHKLDVVLAKIDENRYVIHRVIDIGNGNVVLMGDGNLFGKEKCRKEDIFGIVEKVIRNGKERNLISLKSRLYAFVWRVLLPVRRFYRRYLVRVLS